MANIFKAMPDSWLLGLLIVLCRFKRVNDRWNLGYSISFTYADCNPFDKRYLFEANKSIEYCTPCTIRQSRLNEGCELKLRCKQGYFTKDLDYQDGQKLKCKDGTWANYKTGQPATITDCIAGCKALMPNDINGMLNATYVYGPPANMVRDFEKTLIKILV